MNNIQADNPEEDSIKLYSQKSIAIATYLGGPLAAGVLVRQNYLNSGKEAYGQYAFLIGLVSTLLLFGSPFAIPESALDKVPNAAIPAIYTGLVYLLVEYLQGDTLKTHQEKEGQFYSVWKASGIGAVCLIILLGGIFTYVYMGPEDFDTAEYDQGIEEFQKNEEIAFELFTLLEEGERKKAADFIQKVGLPAWQENIKIIKGLDKIEGLYQALKDQNRDLLRYCRLRIESFQLIEKSIREYSNEYDQEIDRINQEMDKIIEGL